MNKPVVFISHISEERDIAIKLKQILEKIFQGFVEVFVSSSDLNLGDKWLDTLDKKLSQCIVEIVLYSHNSLYRPWISFEAGAGWARQIPLIPVLYGDVKFEDLPIQMQTLQATEVELTGLTQIVRVIKDRVNPAYNIDQFSLERDLSELKEIISNQFKNEKIKKFMIQFYEKRAELGRDFDDIELIFGVIGNGISVRDKKFSGLYLAEQTISIVNDLSIKNGLGSDFSIVKLEDDEVEITKVQFDDMLWRSACKFVISEKFESDFIEFSETLKANNALV